MVRFLQRSFVVLQGIVFTLQPMLVHANAVVIDAAAPVNQQASLISAPNGVPLIDIAQPNSQGLSHNKYLRFDVEQQGLILNNSLNVERSQLGGMLNGNFNFSGQAADLILNEVTGSNRSSLEGLIEVHGKSAGVILANPHGITCNGCGFINTPRATFSTGVPNLVNGQLDSLNVNQGDVLIEGLGLNGSNIDYFDIVSRSAVINAQLHSKNLNIITGRNDVNYTTRGIAAKADDGSTKPSFAISSSALGGMYGERITLLGTEAGVGVNLTGVASTSVGDMNMTADGTINLQNVSAKRDLILSSVTGDVHINADATVSAERDVDIVADVTTVNNGGSIAAANDLHIKSRELHNLYGLIVSGKNQTLEGKTAGTKSELLENKSGSLLTIDGDISIRTELLQNKNPAVINIRTETTDQHHAYTQGRPPTVPHYSDLDYGASYGISATAYANMYSSTLKRFVFLPHPNEVQRIMEAHGLTSWGADDWKTYYNTEAGGYDAANGGAYDLKKWSLVVGESDWFTTSTYVVRVTRDVVDGITGENQLARIQSSGTGNIFINADTLENESSVISSAQNLSLNGTTLNNTGKTLQFTYLIMLHATIPIRARINSQGWAPDHSFHFYIPCARPVPCTETVGTVAGVIAAGGTLSGSLSGTVTNLSTPATDQDLPEFAQSSAVDIKLQEARDLYQQSALELVSPDLFEDAPVDSNFLLETRFAFIDVSQFFGSDYFLSGLNDYTPDNTIKRLGDAYFDTQLVSQLVLQQTQQRYLFANVSNDIEQMKQLLDQGIATANALSLSPGISLSPAQQNALTQDIVWYESVEVNGEKVLVPKLYLTSNRATLSSQSGAVISAGKVTLNVGENLTNSGVIRAAETLDISAVQDINNQGGRIQSGADLNLTSVLGSIRNENTTKRLQHNDKNFREYETSQGEIIAGNNLNIRAAYNIENIGADISATGDASLQAGNDILFLARKRDNASYVEHSKGYFESTGSKHDLSNITVGGNLEAVATRDILLQAIDVTAGNDIQLQAGNDISLVDAQDRTHSKSEHKSSSFFSSKHSITEHETVTSRGTKLKAGGDVLINVEKTAGGLDFNEAAREVTIVGSDIEAGQDILVYAGDSISVSHGVDYQYHHEETTKSGFFGLSNSYRSKTTQEQRQRQAEVGSGNDIHIKAKNNVVLLAPKLRAGGDVDIESEQGSVTIGTAKDTDYSHEEYSSQGLFTWEFGNEGHLDETISHAEITATGDVRITAADGITVELKKHGNLEASIESLSQLPEFAWMADLRQRDDIDWNTLDEQHDYWQQHESGIGGPGITFLTIAISIASGGITSGFFADLAADIGIASATGTAAFEAGLNTLIQKAGLSLINNGGNIGAVFEELISTDNLLAIATASITAGLLEGAGVANHDFSKGFLAPDAILKNLQNQILEATIRSGVNTVVTGTDFTDSLKSNLRFAAASVIGAQLSQEIGKALDHSETRAFQLIAHAAVGCVSGQISSGQCGAGATGAFAGEAAALAYRNSLADDMQDLINNNPSEEQINAKLFEWQTNGVDIARLAGGLAALISGADAEGVGVGSNAGGTSTANNIVILIPLLYAAAAFSSGYYGTLSAKQVVTGLISNDPLGQALYNASPEVVLKAISHVGEGVRLVVTYVDEATGKTVSGAWNDLSKPTQNRLIGGVGLVAVAIPSVKFLKKVGTGKRLPNVNGSNIQRVDASKANVGYIRPPHDPTKPIYDFDADGTTQYVRVFNEGPKSRKVGQWMMRKEDIKGLTPAQIQDKFDLPELPTRIVDVTPPAGIKIRTGTVNSGNFGGSGGGIQFEVLGRYYEYLVC